MLYAKKNKEGICLKNLIKTGINGLQIFSMGNIEIIKLMLEDLTSSRVQTIGIFLSKIN
jgi:hypothetical protein